jgi:hypothetical protein
VSIELEEQVVELTALEDQGPTVSEWRQAFKTLLPDGTIVDVAVSDAEEGIIIESELLVVRNGAEISRYFVLMSDCIEYHTDHDAKEAGSDPRGRIMLQDILRFECVAENLTMFVEAADEKRPLVLKSATKALFNDWTKEWETLLAGQLGDKFVVTEESAQTTDRPAPVLPGDTAEAMPESPPSRRIAQSNSEHVESKQSHVFIDSPIVVVKKGKGEERHGVLWTDRFEYFTTEHEFQNDSKPRCRIPLDQFIGFEETGDTFIIQLEDRAMTVQIAGDPSLLRQWSKAWSDVGIGEAHLKPPIHPSPAIMSTSTAPSRTPQKSVGGTPFVKQGEIQVVRKNERETRFLALTSEQIQIYNSAQEVLASTYPRMRIVGSDIADVKPFDKGFVVELQNAQEIEFECAPQDEVDEWVSVITSLAAAKRRSRHAVCQPEELKADEYLMEGAVKIVHGGVGRSQRQLFRISEDRFSYAADAAAIEKPAETTSQPLRGVQSVDDLANGQGFLIKLEVGGTIEMHVTPKDKQRWQEAWQAFMASKPAAAIPMGANPLPTFGRADSTARNKQNSSRASRAQNVLPGGEQNTQNSSRASRAQNVLAGGEPFGDEARQASMAKKPSTATPRGTSTVGRAGPPTTPRISSRASLPQGTTEQQQQQGTTEQHGTAAVGRSPRESQAPRHPRAASVSPTRERAEAEANWLKEATAGIPAFAATKDTPKWSLGCLEDPQLQAWLQKLAQREAPLHHGLLGVQPQGQLVTGYFVLFRDRLDFWNSTTEAAACQRPKGRIIMTDIRGLELVNNGFVVNYKGRKMGLHVRNNDDFHAWTCALLGALAPSQGGTGRVGGNLSDLCGGDRSKSAPPKVGKIDQQLIDRMRKQLLGMVPQGGDKFAVFAQRHSDMISATELAHTIFKKNGAKSEMLGKIEVHDFVCALAGNGSDRIKVTKLISFIENGAMPGKGSCHQMVPRVARLAEKKQKIEAENGTLGKTDIKDNHLRRYSCGGFSRDAKSPPPKSIAIKTNDSYPRDGGFAFNGSPVCEKVTALEPGDNERRTVNREFLSKDKPLAEKTTGECVITPRMNIGNLDWIKINHCSQHVYADPECSRQHRPLGNDGNHTRIGEKDRKPIQPRTCLTEKITEPGRRPLMDTAHKQAMADLKAEKLTDAGRTGTGWAAPYGEANVDKCRSLASRSFASPGSFGIL